MSLLWILTHSYGAGVGASVMTGAAMGAAARSAACSDASDSSRLTHVSPCLVRVNWLSHGQGLNRAEAPSSQSTRPHARPFGDELGDSDPKVTGP